MVSEKPLDLVVERVGFSEVHEPDRASRDLVLICRADAAFSRANLCSATRARFPVSVEFPVQRQDQRHILGDLEVCRSHIDPLAANLFDLVDQVAGIEDDAVADDRKLARTHDSRGKQREFEHFSVDDQGVPGVVASLKAHDHVRSE
jgi:hypothetical protein